MISIECIERPSYEEFRRHYLEKRRPVRIRGGIDDWPAMSRWSFDYIAQTLGARRISPVILSRGKFHVDVDNGVLVAEMDFPTYLSHLKTSDLPSYYLRLPLEDEYATLFGADYEVPGYCQKRVLLKRNLWAGGAGTASDIHYDMTHNIVAQVVGRRRVMLFGPEQTDRLYPYPVRTLNWHHSRVRAETPDYEKYPRYRQARPIELELGRGEMLFIPQGVWHRFESLEPSIAVNFFWLTKRLVPKMAISRLLWVAKGVRT